MIDCQKSKYYFFLKERIYLNSEATHTKTFKNKQRKENTLKKIYAYEIFEGDKGVIIAPSYKKAKKILKKECGIKVADNDTAYYNGNKAYLYEVGKVKNNKIYATFEY